MLTTISQLFITMTILTAIMSQSPMLLSILVVIMALSVGLILMTTFSQWLMFAIFMLYVGGMMILFFYMVSLAHEKKVTLKYDSAWLGFVAVLSWKMYYDNDIMNFFPSNLYQVLSTSFLLLIVIYLLLALVLISKLLKHYKSSMKSTFHD